MRNAVEEMLRFLNTVHSGRRRVAISDVAFKNASLDEVRAVTGHEIGHYVLKHTWWGVLFYSIAAIILFWIADRTFPWFARRFGSSAALTRAIGAAAVDARCVWQYPVLPSAEAVGGHRPAGTEER